MRRPSAVADAGNGAPLNTRCAPPSTDTVAGGEEGDELPDVSETLQVRNHVAHLVDVLGQQHPLGAVAILHIVLVPGHRVADGAPEVPALALQHPAVLHSHDGVGTAAYR